MLNHGNTTYKTLFHTASVAFMLLFSYAEASTVHISLNKLPQNLDILTATDSTSLRFAQLIAPSLLGEGSTSPKGYALAENVSRNDDATAYHITLKKDLYDHTGRRIDATYIKSYYAKFKNSPYAMTLSLLSDISVTSPTTLTFNLSAPDIWFYRALSLPIAETGPYTVSSFSDNKLILTPSKEASPTLIFTSAKEPLVRYLKLRKGDVDILHNDLPPLFFAQGEKDGLSTYSTPSASYTYIGMNLSQMPFKDISVRKAVSYAIDREKIIHGLLRGHATIAKSLLLKDQFGYQAQTPTYNPEKAQEILENAGYPVKNDGYRLTLSLNITTNPLSQRIAQVLQQQFKAIGINLKTYAREWGSFYRDVKKGNFQSYLLSWTGPYDADIFHSIFHSNQLPPQGLNRSRYNNTNFDNILDKMMQETNDFQRKKLIEQVQRTQFEEMLYIPLWRKNHISLSRKNIQGYIPQQDGSFIPLTHVTPLIETNDERNIP